MVNTGCVKSEAVTPMPRHLSREARERPLKVCVLGNNCAGNCTYVASGLTSVLVDAGLSGRETAKRLAEIGVTTDSISAICLTHEHGDHTSVLAALSRAGRIPLYANNRPELALAAVTEALTKRGLTYVKVVVAPPDRISAVWEGCLP